MSAEQLLQEFSKVEADRSTWETTWELAADFVLPRQANFITKNHTPGENRSERIYDSTAPLALERFAAAMESMLTPRTQKWHRLQASDTNLMKAQAVKEWFEEVNRALFKARYRPKANYASNQHEVYMSLGAFGTGALFTDDVPGQGIRYLAIPLSELYVETDAYGVTDRVWRKFELNLRQAIQRFGEDNLHPDMVKEGTKNTKKMFEFVHVVGPNTQYDPTRADKTGMEFASAYIDKKYKHIISSGGYSSFPYSVSRYVVAPGEVYGRSPAINMMSDIQMVNTVSRDQIRISHKLADPPLLIHDDGILGFGATEVNLNAGGLNPGGVNADGRQMIQPMQTGGNPQLAEALLEQRRRNINDAFLVTLFQILVETPQMTATEAMLRAQEKGQLLGPTISRQQSEALGPMIEREVDILARAGALPELPPELVEAGGDYEIEYDSPMSRMMQSEEVVGFQRSIETMAPILQLKPELLETYDSDKMMRDVNYINGVPTAWLLTEDEVAENDAARQEAMAEQEQMAAVPDAAAALANTAKAQESMAKARTM